MSVSSIKSSPRTRPGRKSRERGAHGVARRAVATPAVEAVDRARRAGGPEDRALYACSCGVKFSADVSASVGCPHCGEHQAW